MDDNFLATTKYISLNPIGIPVEKAKTNKYIKLVKKDTRISSNNEEEIEYPENEVKFFNIHLTNENICCNTNRSDNNLLLVQNKNRFLYTSYSNSNFDECCKLNNSENNNINDRDKISLPKSCFSPNRKKRKIILEQKTKIKGKNGKLYALETKDNKEEQKEEEKKNYRKDKNGTEICKKNKKEIKIGFDEPFVRITLIESFKKYNVLDESTLKGKRYFNKRDDCQCCLIY